MGVAGGEIKDPLTGTSFSVKSGQVVGPWCPNFPFNILFSVIEPQGLPVFKCKTGGGAVQVDVDAKTNFESEALKALNKDKKKVKKLANTYNFFLASQTIMKQIPRLLGPTMHKLGKFPTLLEHGEDITEKIDSIRGTVKFQLKKVLTMGVACGHVEMSQEQLFANTMITINFLVSLLKKNWQNIKTLHLKSTMGPSHRIY